MNEENKNEEVVTAATDTPRKETIVYDDFVKLDIAIGVIASVEVVEGADKLLRLMVEVGEAEPRQIVSGIREYFADEQVLVGKQCPFVLNLEPRTIRGLESQGMILAANHEDIFALLVPHNELPAGTRVS
jgi:methionine--tRNA ligase beta chain